MRRSRYFLVLFFLMFSTMNSGHAQVVNTNEAILILESDDLHLFEVGHTQLQTLKMEAQPKNWKRINTIIHKDKIVYASVETLLAGEIWLFDIHGNKEVLAIPPLENLVDIVSVHIFWNFILVQAYTQENNQIRAEVVWLIDLDTKEVIPWYWDCTALVVLAESQELGFSCSLDRDLILSDDVPENILLLRKSILPNPESTLYSYEFQRPREIWMYSGWHNIGDTKAVIALSRNHQIEIVELSWRNGFVETRVVKSYDGGSNYIENVNPFSYTLRLSPDEKLLFLDIPDLEIRSTILDIATGELIITLADLVETRIYPLFTWSTMPGQFYVLHQAPETGETLSWFKIENLSLSQEKHWDVTLPLLRVHNLYAIEYP